MKSNENRSAEREDTSRYSSDAHHVTSTSRMHRQRRMSLAELRNEIVRLDKVDSNNMKSKADAAYADLNIDAALRWEKRLKRYSAQLHDAVDSILDRELSLGLFTDGRLRWKGPAWLQMIRNSKLQELSTWNKILGKMPLEQQVWNLSKVIDYDPNIDYAYNLRAIAHAEQRHFEMAMDDFNRAISIEPKFHGYYVNRGIARSLNEEDELALQDFNMAITLDPSIDEAYSARGILYIDMDDYKLALFDFSRAIELDPDHARYYINRGNVYDVLGQKDLALIDYTKAIHINPKSGTAYTNRGLLFYEMDNYKRAVKDFSKAIKLGHVEAEIYQKRADSYKKLGKYEKSDQDILYALELEGKCFKG